MKKLLGAFVMLINSLLLIYMIFPGTLFIFWSGDSIHANNGLQIASNFILWLLASLIIVMNLKAGWHIFQNKAGKRTYIFLGIQIILISIFFSVTAFLES